MKLVQSETIEPVILKLFYTDPKYCTLIGDVFDKKWFNDEHYGSIIKLVCSFYKKRMKLPKNKTIELLIQKVFYDEKNEKAVELYNELSTKLKMTYSINIEEYDREHLDGEVLGYIKQRGLYWTIADNFEEMTGSNTVKPIVDNLTFFENLNFDMDLGMDYLKDHESHREELLNPESRMSTGWDSLDFKTSGGWYTDGRCLCLFMGQTHIGKSLFLSNMAANMLKNNKFCLVISLEMSQHVYATRIDAHLSKLDINNLKNNIEELKNSVEIISDTCPDGKIIIKEFPPDSITCGTIKNYIDRVIQLYGRKPDAILIDYLSLLLPENKASEGSYTKYKEVATGMRTLSYTFNSPVISVYQSNRDGYDKTDLNVAQSSDSMGIPMTADFIGGIFQNEGDKEAGIINVALLKNRLGGQVGDVVRFNINYTNLKISDMDKSVAVPDTVADEIMEEIDIEIEGL